MQGGGDRIPAKGLEKTLLKTLGEAQDFGHTTSTMNTYPEICSEVGLDCTTCTEATARQLAKVCTGLRGKTIGQMFVQIYTDPACAKMHAHFAEAYLAATAPPRMMAASAASARTMAAVA